MSVLQARSKNRNCFKITELSNRNDDDSISNAIQEEIMALYNQKQER